jgi:hypothetical protein
VQNATNGIYGQSMGQGAPGHGQSYRPVNHGAVGPSAVQGTGQGAAQGAYPGLVSGYPHHSGVPPQALPEAPMPVEGASQVAAPALTAHASAHASAAGSSHATAAAPGADRKSAAPPKSRKALWIALALFLLVAASSIVGLFALRAKNPSALIPGATATLPTNITSSIASSALPAGPASGAVTAASQAAAADSAGAAATAPTAATLAPTTVSPSANNSANAAGSATTRGSASPAGPTGSVTSGPVRDELKPTATTSATTSAPAPDSKSFDAKRANAALTKQSASLAGCRRKGGVHGNGAAVVLFTSDGQANQVSLEAPYQGTTEGTCVVNLLKRAKMDPFEGPPGQVRFTFSLPE